MKILVMGTGGIGGYFGGRLAAAGNDVTFVARAAHLEAILCDGLQVLSPMATSP
jgi:2-dehydropantoate 2-reductase